MKKISHPKFFITGIIIAIIILILDLYSKSIIFNILDNQEHQIIRITSFFNLVKVWNMGVSFGMFNDLTHGKIILSILAISITTILIIWLSRITEKHMSIALGLIIGGAIGNIIDRLINGAVADFLDFHLMGHHWPSFNVADSAITIGAIILIFDEFILPKLKHKSHANTKN